MTYEDSERKRGGLPARAARIRLLQLAALILVTIGWTLVADAIVSARPYSLYILAALSLLGLTTGMVAAGWYLGGRPGR